GAGFSAPLGLPVMSNFLEVSREQHVRRPTEYAHFRDIFDRLRDLHFSKSYYASDLMNVEDILSILEMEAVAKQDQSARDAFVRYMSDVVSYHTPTFAQDSHLDAGWPSTLRLVDP